MSKSKTKIVLSEEESDNNKESENKKENVEEEFADYLFRFGKYKLMLASQIVSLETVNPKNKDKMKTGVNYLQWCLKNVLFLTADDKIIIQKILDNYLKK